MGATARLALSRARVASAYTATVSAALVSLGPTAPRVLLPTVVSRAANTPRRRASRRLVLQPHTLPLLWATTTMSGPSRLTVVTWTPAGASLMTSSMPTPTTTSSTPARSVLTTTSGLRTTTDAPLRTLINTALLPPLRL